MDRGNFYLEEGFPFTGRRLEKLKAFLGKSGLDYDSQIQYSVMLCTKDGRLAGCGSRQDNVLKCIAIEDEFQGEGLLQAVVTELMKNACQEGFPHLFLFTKPQYREIFGDMGFYYVMDTRDMLLMENRKEGIREYVKKEAEPFQRDERKPVGAIVMNANPFTKGHRYLIRQAARDCRLLHVFVLSQDASEFPSQVRLKLVQEGCRDLEGVYVHGSSKYLISHATFPDYFLKDKANASDQAAVLDLKIFGVYFKEAFHIERRYVGEEPFSPITRLYNEQMKKLLPGYGIEVVEIPRARAEDKIISATLVREKFLEGKLEEVEKLVPASTYGYLASREGQALRKTLLEKAGLSRGFEEFQRDRL